ncbi:type I restriction enzyme HsdR N-terminal domain-containing protein [Nostoc sp. PCC 7107]|uniref:type I restriction enzyme HsdR N-terminal domain-containing protein n=1 Tax=Nostoc sp. PCC 7107 TaxID=317936 RepID=UPI00029F2772|nr:type I restriction enzyme HsdR N-terminal domain-containing protein [Nostoc sp. PCC 7107]AFY43186.1 hypothetical protein Nos7107_2585 [Nostoc sp. PCC 7107]
MATLNEEVSKILNIYKRNYTKYTKCLIRGKEIVIDGRPEEKVRQLFIYFLVNKRNLFPNKINIKVESNNHDIEIYKTVINTYFNPYCPPIMIVEVKREDENLSNHKAQIERYLKKSSAEIGILYNYSEIIAYTKQDGVFTSKYLNSLDDVPPLILQTSNTLEKDTSEFKKAINGNFESFTYLVKKYGKYKLNTIIFKLKEEELQISGYFFEIQNEKVYCYVYGKSPKKQQSFNSQEFDKLISITYGKI